MNAGSTFLKYRSILKEEAIEYILVIGSKGDGRPIKMDSEREKRKNGSPKLLGLPTSNEPEHSMV